MLKNVKRWEDLVHQVPALLAAIPESEFTKRPAPEKWSKKELLGHLIDSAANNHQRFVRTQFESTPNIRYDQSNWNSKSRYQEMDSKNLIGFWTTYNTHLIELVRRIPEADLNRECNSGESTPKTLAWLIDDYVEHMEYHLRQMIVLEGKFDTHYGIPQVN